MCLYFSVGAEHDGDGRSCLVERLCGLGLLQLYRPPRAGEAEAPLTSSSHIPLLHNIDDDLVSVGHVMTSFSVSSLDSSWDSTNARPTWTTPSPRSLSCTRTRCCSTSSETWSSCSEPTAPSASIALRGGMTGGLMLRFHLQRIQYYISDMHLSKRNLICLYSDRFCLWLRQPVCSC